MEEFEYVIAKAKKKGEEFLYLDCEGIDDISALASLSSLKELVLSDCGKVRDFSQLNRLSNLEKLSLRGDVKVDLLSSMTNLRKLELSNCLNVSDISALSSLRNLRELRLFSLGVTDLSPLSSLINLENLAILECNGVKDLTPLSSLINLKRLKMFSCNGVRDLSPLSSLSKLFRLCLWDCVGIVDVSPLSSLSNLRGLLVSGSIGISDLSPVSKLINLRELELNGCSRIKDIGFLRGFLDLVYLDLSDCTEIEDFSPLCYLSKLDSNQLWLPMDEDIDSVLPSSSTAIHRDDRGRLHNDKGPAVSCREGLSLYYWHGIAIPREWIEKSPPPVEEALMWPHSEQRWAAFELIGWETVLQSVEHRVLDENPDPEIGTLLELNIPNLGREKFLKVRCGTGRYFVIPVPRNKRTARGANAWTWGLKAYEYRPEVRT